MFVTRAGVKNDRIERFSAVMDEIDPRPVKKGPSAGGLALSDGEEAEFFRALAGPLYLKTRVCKPVLQRLGEALSAGGATYDEIVSIEHVLPQTVDENSEWAKLLPDPQTRLLWIHRIANLVFLTHRINTRASRRPSIRSRTLPSIQSRRHGTTRQAAQGHRLELSTALNS